jgi:N-acetylated-alpha-linked acidic dipeptidase
VVAYLNADDVTQGPRFAGSGSPSLKPLIRDVTGLVPDPSGRGSVRAMWLERVHGDTAALTLANLGGGSDFAGFYHHLGIPSGGIGFDGPDGIYHSMYDSYDWMSRFGDPTYAAHRAGAQLVSVILGRLANGDILPLDYAAFGSEMSALVTQLDSGLVRKRWSVSTQGLKDALDRFTGVARVFNTARTAVATVDSDRAARVNRGARQPAVVSQLAVCLGRGQRLRDDGVSHGQ